MLVAFSSYAQLRTAKDFWDSHDITNRFQQRGLRIFEEPNDAVNYMFSTMSAVGFEPMRGEGIKWKGNVEKEIIYSK